MSACGNVLPHHRHFSLGSRPFASCRAPLGRTLRLLRTRSVRLILKAQYSRVLARIVIGSSYTTVTRFPAAAHWLRPPSGQLAAPAAVPKVVWGLVHPRKPRRGDRTLRACGGGRDAARWHRLDNRLSVIWTEIGGVAQQSCRQPDGALARASWNVDKGGPRWRSTFRLVVRRARLPNRAYNLIPIQAEIFVSPPFGRRGAHAVNSLVATSSSLGDPET